MRLLAIYACFSDSGSRKINKRQILDRISHLSSTALHLFSCLWGLVATLVDKGAALSATISHLCPPATLAEMKKSALASVSHRADWSHYSH